MDIILGIMYFYTNFFEEKILRDSKAKWLAQSHVDN